MVECHFLLWPYWVKGSIFEEIIDVVVVDLNVGDKDTVTTVFVHVLGFTRLCCADHISKFWVSLLPASCKEHKQVHKREKKKIDTTVNIF